MKIYGFVGFADSGKGTAATALVDTGYRPIAFADALKDCLCAIFGWSRAMLEGDTPQSRAWRETVDPWWADKLGIPNFTPRLAMRLFGTEAMRENFHKDIWVLVLQRRLEMLKADRIIVTDVRFPNEIAMVRAMGGKVYRIRRGPEPAWWPIAVEACRGSAAAREQMETIHRIHESEWAWIDEPPDGIIENNTTVAELLRRVRGLCK